MSMENLTFKFYDDAALTQQTPPVIQLTHQSDFSDNPKTRHFRFGSPLANRKLQANSNPGVANITVAPVYILPAWAASTAYTLGQSRVPTASNGFRYVVQTAGTTGSTEPTWPTAIGSTVADGSVLWRCEAAIHAPTEYRLALTEAGLSSATPGAALVIGTEVLGGSAEAVDVWMDVTNAVSTVSSNSGQPEIALAINEVIEAVITQDPQGVIEA